MFRTIKQRINDIRTIKTTCLSAERHANADGETEPGLEHFVLAALDLPDGTASKSFERISADSRDFRAAIARQYDNALKSIGVDTSLSEAACTPTNKGIYQSRPQVQAFMQRLANRHKTAPGEPLLGAHIIEAIASFEHGVASRTFATMGVDREMLMKAARVEADLALEKARSG